MVQQLVVEQAEVAERVAGSLSVAAYVVAAERAEPLAELAVVV